MRRLLLAILLLLLPASAFAQQASVTYMPLVASFQFVNRVTFNIALAAPVIETETVAPNTPSCHTLRAKLAAQVAASPQSYALVFAVAVVTSSAVTTAGAPTGSGQTLDSPITDAALFSAINAAWSSIAGCITFP
jgi:hypothetical protein